MKRTVNLIALLFLFCFDPLIGHGLAGGVLVHGDQDSFTTIKELSKATWRKKNYVLSCNTNNGICERVDNVPTAKACTNCYFKIWFDEKLEDDVVCTPSQEFYLTVESKWVPAFKLKQGDILLSKTRGLIDVQRIEFFEQPLEVYSIEVKDNHNYFVGRYGVLTHNMFVPALYTVATPLVFSSGVAAGGIFSGCFGPVVAIGGAALGGIIGVIIKKIIQKNKVPTYDLCFDVDKIKGQQSGIFDIKSVELDKDGAQVPGKPTENDGFIPKKKWDGKKVRHRRGYGWPDEKGNIWIPTGPKGHGCPHWDVQFPGGGYKNIVPGGGERGKK